jgi:hypothetical protein
MEPRDSAIIYNPEATLEPPTVGLLGSKDDHLPADLDQRPVRKHISYAKTHDRCQGNDETFHEVIVLGISHAAQRNEYSGLQGALEEH